jgi:hypothetical protein
MTEADANADATPDGDAVPDLTTPPQTAEEWAADRDKWVHFARHNEERAKAATAEAKRNADASKRLQEIEDAAKTEAERLAERVNTAEQRAQQAELTLARHRIAAAKGLPPEAVDLLTGADEAEIEANADRLLSLIPAGPPATPPMIPGAADIGPQGDAAGKPRQLNRADLKTLTPQQILDAEAAGQLVDLYAGNLT